MAPAQTQMVLLQRSLWSWYDDSWILRDNTIERPWWSHNHKEKQPTFLYLLGMLWYNRFLVPWQYAWMLLPRQSLQMTSALRCKYVGPYPCPFRAITSIREDSLKSERNISLKNYLFQGEGSVISCTIPQKWTNFIFNQTHYDSSQSSLKSN